MHRLISKLTRFRLILLIVLLLIFNLFYLVYHLIYLPHDEKENLVTVNILPGTSTYVIGLTLQRHDLIFSPLLFVVYTRLTGTNKRLQAGQYELNTNMSMSELVRTIQTGSRANEVIVTIPEGFTIQQIADLLQNQAIMKSEKFLSAVSDAKYLNRMNINRENLEGYIFPDTYHLYYHVSAERVVEIMLNRFEEIVIPLYNRYRRRTGLTLDEIIILASIIQQEAAVQHEMPTISGVFHNRLRLNMLLQADPTVRYATQRFTEPIRVEDLLIDSPYNTYRYTGLPIGPIANPGALAIAAALNPERSDYLYFVSRNDGTHEFSRTLAEHNTAVVRFRRSTQLMNQINRPVSERNNLENN